MGDTELQDVDLLALLDDIGGDAGALLYDPVFDALSDGIAASSSTSITEPQAPSTAETEATTSSSQTTESAHALRCRRNRKRRKEEVNELKASAAALKERLRRLTRSDTTSDESKWRQVSRRTLAETQQSLLRNKRLRESLEQYLAVARRIQQTVETAPDVQQSQQSLGLTTDRAIKDEVSLDTAFEHDSTRFDDLFQSIHTVYQQRQWEDQLAFMKLGQRKVSMEMTTDNHNQSIDVCMQVMEAQLLPCSFTYVSDALWKHLSSPSAPPSTENSAPSTALAAYGNDLFGDCGSECKTAARAETETPGRLAVRRYAEPGRLVLVWECDGCFQCDSSMQPIGKVVERGWCIVESAAEGTAAVVRIQVQYHPTSTGTATGSKVTGASSVKPCYATPSVSLSTDVTLKLYRGTIARTFGAIECEGVFKEAKCLAKPRACA